MNSRPDKIRMDLAAFNLALNEAFLERHQRQPWPEYPWNNAQQVRLNSVKTGTLILTCPTETKYRTLPFRLTQQLQVNLDPALIEVIWDELSKNHSQFFIQPTWVLTFETGPLTGFIYQSIHQCFLTDFKLDSDNVPSNQIGMLDCMVDQSTDQRTDRKVMVFLFRAPDCAQAETTVETILDGLEATIEEHGHLLVNEFMKPLRRFGAISVGQFNRFFEAYYQDQNGFKIFVDEIAKQVPDIQGILDPSQYHISSSPGIN